MVTKPRGRIPPPRRRFGADMKKILGVYSAPRPHWVGDGFPARSLFSYASHGRDLSPFLLLDYAGPWGCPSPSSAVASPCSRSAWACA